MSEQDPKPVDVDLSDAWPAVGEVPALVSVDLPFGPMPGPQPAPDDRTGIPADWHTSTYFARIDPETGAILETGYMPVAGLAMLAGQFEALYAAVQADAETQYMKLPEMVLTERTPCPARLDRTTLRDLPVPCRIEITNPGDLPSRYDWQAATAALTFDHPGSYEIRVKAVPHRDGVFTVTI